MRILESASHVQGPSEQGLVGCAVAIGNFDGVHLGHRALLARTVAAARAAGTPAVVLTFDPHPARVLAPALAPRLISSRARKRELLAAAGIDVLVEQPFDLAFAATTPSEFEHLLLDVLGARHVVVGYDFSYGKARAGRTESLRAACAARGGALEVVSAVEVDGVVASSTKVREFVRSGNVSAASRLLARDFDVEGPVVRGAGRGRRIGIPTANVRTDGELLPALGVYATRVHLEDGTIARGACNIGLNPTFRSDASAAGEAEATVEVHLLEHGRDLYGETLRVAFVARLREERKFPGVDALVAQIHRDIASAASVLGAP